MDRESEEGLFSSFLPHGRVVEKAEHCWQTNSFSGSRIVKCTLTTRWYCWYLFLHLFVGFPVSSAKQRPDKRAFNLSSRDPWKASEKIKSNVSQLNRVRSTQRFLLQRLFRVMQRNYSPCVPTLDLRVNLASRRKKKKQKKKRIYIGQTSWLLSFPYLCVAGNL